MHLFRPKQHHNVQLLRSPDEKGETGLSIDNIKPLLKLLTGQGISLQQLLSDSHIPLTELAKPDGFISLSQLLRIIQNAHHLNDKKDHALLLGQQFFIHHEGPLTSRIMSCQTTQHAMEVLCEYQNLFSQILELDFKVDLNPILSLPASSYQHTHQLQKSGVFTLTSKTDLGVALPYFIEYTFSALYSLGKYCLGLNSLPITFEFSYPDDGRINSFNEFFNTHTQHCCHIRFNCLENRVIFPGSILEKPILFYNQEQEKISHERCQKHLNQVAQDMELIRKVKHAMRQQAFTDLSLEFISEQLHMTPRTLRRHLSKQGISYKELLENERKRQALEKINHSHISIEALALQLGYQNTSSFSRAFKRWFGVAPNFYNHQTPTSLNNIS